MQNNLIKTKKEISALENWVRTNLTQAKVDEIKAQLDWSNYKYTSSIRLNRKWRIKEVESFCDISGLPIATVNEYIPAVMITQG